MGQRRDSGTSTAARSSTRAPCASAGRRRRRRGVGRSTWGRTHQWHDQASAWTWRWGVSAKRRSSRCFQVFRDGRGARTTRETATCGSWRAHLRHTLGLQSLAQKVALRGRACKQLVRLVLLLLGRRAVVASRLCHGERVRLCAKSCGLLEARMFPAKAARSSASKPAFFFSFSLPSFSAQPPLFDPPPARPPSSPPRASCMVCPPRHRMTPDAQVRTANPPCVP